LLTRIACRLDFGATFYLDCSVPAGNDQDSQNAIGLSRQSGAVAFATTHWSVVAGEKIRLRERCFILNRDGRTGATAAQRGERLKKVKKKLV